MKTLSQSNWLGPILILALGSLNILFGALQLGNIYQGPDEVSTEMTSAVYFTSPIPIVLHIVAGTLLNFLGPLQFVPSFRKRRPTWHKWSGYLLILSGLMVGLTGLWMNHFFPQYGGWLKYSGITTYSMGIIASLAIALNAIVNGKVYKHRVWMMRAIAIGLAPATQRLFVLPIFFINGGISDLVIGLVIWGGLMLNLGVVEYVLRWERNDTSVGLQVQESLSS